MQLNNIKSVAGLEPNYVSYLILNHCEYPYISDCMGCTYSQSRKWLHYLFEGLENELRLVVEFEYELYVRFLLYVLKTFALYHHDPASPAPLVFGTIRVQSIGRVLHFSL